MTNEIMTIDEAIKHCEKVASGHERNCEIFADDPELYAINREWADNYHNIADWLRKLNDIKHLFSITEKLFKACLRDFSKDIVDGHEILYSEHKQLREIFEEINTDDRN